MGRPTSQTFTLAAASAFPWIPLDPNINPFNVAFTVVKAEGGKDVTYKVQRTMTDLRVETSAVAIDTIVSAVNVSASGVSTRDGVITTPSMGIRFNATVVSGASSTLTFTVLQAGVSHG